jgi:hypothetical protein
MEDVPPITPTTRAGRRRDSLGLLESIFEALYQGLLGRLSRSGRRGGMGRHRTRSSSSFPKNTGSKVGVCV